MGFAQHAFEPDLILGMNSQIHLRVVTRNLRDTDKDNGLGCHLTGLKRVISLLAGKAKARKLVHMGFVRRGAWPAQEVYGRGQMGMRNYHCALG